MFPGSDELFKQMLKDNKKQLESKKSNAKGMACSRCHFFNEYITEPNKDDGTYLCYKCRKF